jgi:hypothetical protein
MIKASQARVRLVFIHHLRLSNTPAIDRGPVRSTGSARDTRYRIQCRFQSMKLCLYILEGGERGAGADRRVRRGFMIFVYL